MRKITVFLVVVLFSICSAGFVSAISFNGHEYQIIEVSGTTWSAARTAAIALGTGWDLAAITSTEEQDFLNTQIPIPSSRTQFWVGGYQDPGSSPTANWNWVTGEGWGYTNWDNPPQPDDWMGDQIYLALDSNSGQWKWDDNYNTLQFTAGFIAERSAPVPEPATMFLLGTGLLGLAGIRRKKFQKK